MNPEKIFIYIDHNIIQYDYELTLNLKQNSDLCFVYSEEHFNEINRKEDERFFETLRRIEARKLKIKLDAEFNIINEAIILDYQDPKALYDDYLLTIKDSKKYTNLFLNLQPYFMGNLSAINPIDVKVEFEEQMKALIASMPLAGLPEELFNNLHKIINCIGVELQRTLELVSNEILPIEKMRKKITTKSLSDLKYEDGFIIDQIWNLVENSFPGIEKDQLFGKKPLPFMSKKNIPLFLSVVQCHNVLNTLGYWPDEGLTKISKVYGINSDASHIAHSAFCSGIISADNRLCKKAQAIYQYLGLNKNVIQIKFNN